MAQGEHGNFLAGSKEFASAGWYLNSQLNFFHLILSSIMSSHPNVREFDNTDLIKSPSNSEELMVLKYKECLQQCCEVRECCKCEEQEAHEQKDCEERERAVCKEVHRGKVSMNGL